jgi:hypothetical protein
MASEHQNQYNSGNSGSCLRGSKFNQNTFEVVRCDVTKLNVPLLINIYFYEFYFPIVP